MSTSWKDRVALVTGAASGIGLATARLFASRGARVVLADLNEPGGRQAAAELGEDSLFVRVDTTDEASVQGLIREVGDRFGRVDLLHNNAAILTRRESLEAWDVKDYRREIDVNLNALFIMARAALPLMRAAGGGAIVNTASVGALIAVPASLAYATAKAGVLGFTRSLAALLEPDRIRVHAVLPNLVETPMVADRPPGYDQAGILQPEDIARAVEWLAEREDLSGFFLAVHPGPDGQARFFRVNEPTQEPI